MFASFSRIFKRSAPKGKGQSESPFSAPASDAAAQAPAESQADTVVSDIPESEGDIQELEPLAPEGSQGEVLALPLRQVMKHIPKEFMGTAMPTAATGKKFTIPKSSVIQQLSTGAVRVAFGHIRRIAPGGLFVDANLHDNKLIDLPLKEILKRLEPDAYHCRANQGVKNVPDSIADLFGPKGQGLTDVRILKKGDIKSNGMAALGSSAVQTQPPFPVTKKEEDSDFIVPSQVASQTSPPIVVPGMVPTHDPAAGASIAASEALKEAMMKASAASGINSSGVA